MHTIGGQLTSCLSFKWNQNDTCIKELEKDLTSIAKSSIETNLVLNIGKAKFMVISSNQLSAQKMNNYNNTELERVTAWKNIQDIYQKIHRSY